MEERKLYLKKKKVWLRFINSLSVLIFYLFLFHGNERIWEDNIVILHISLFIIVITTSVIRLVKNLKNNMVLSYNSEGISSSFLEEMIPWERISDIDLNFNTIYNIELVLFCSTKQPWYKRIISLNSFISISKKKTKFEMKIVDCDPEEVYYQMQSFLIKWKAENED